MYSYLLKLRSTYLGKAVYIQHMPVVVNLCYFRSSCLWSGVMVGACCRGSCRAG